MQLKGIIKNMAAKTGIKANALLQNYMLERLLEKINDSSSIIEEIKEDKTIQGIWKAYTKRFVYANDIAFEDNIVALIKLFEMYSK